MKRRLVTCLVVAGLTVATAGSAPASDHGTGTEPTLPFAQPATVPMRGCQSFPLDPAEPTGAPSAVQVFYAYRTGQPDRYEQVVEQLARIVDRVDWLIDESTNYDQHVNLSCRRQHNGTYGDYARVLVERLEVTPPAGEDPVVFKTVEQRLVAAGYNDTNRWYLVFTDFNADSAATVCFDTGSCEAVVELWDSGVADHELIHTFGAGHGWATEDGRSYCHDVMTCWQSWWLADPDLNTYYDPSEPGASFYIDPYPDARTWNVARSPALSTPACCDVGANSDQLTAQERTVESGSLGTVPPGFSALGGATTTVTPSCGRANVSCRYYDGRRSLQVSTSSASANSGFILTGNAATTHPSVTAGQRYTFFVRLRSDVAGKVRLRLRWLNSSNGVISESQSAETTLTPNWLEWSLNATAPTGAVRALPSVVTSFAQPSFAFHADGLQLGRCTPACRPDSHRDGRLDILGFEASNGGWMKLRNNDDGTFAHDGFAVTGMTRPEQAVSLDYSRDGFPDLMAFEAPNGGWVRLRNLRDGGFVHDGFAITGQPVPHKTVVLDYNRDGLPDLLDFELTTATSGVWARLRNNGNSSFTRDGTAVSATKPDHVVVLDYDKDALPDLLAFAAGTWTKFRNNGNGTFSNAGAAVSGLTTPDQVVVVDYDKDGHLDLLDFESPTSGGSWVRLRNNGSGTFTWTGIAVSGLTRPDQVVLSDYDKDGHLDLFDFESTTMNGSWVRLRNLGDGTFHWTGFASGAGLQRPEKVALIDVV